MTREFRRLPVGAMEFGYYRAVTMGRRADRLFHTLVVMGAALSGCGGKSAQDGSGGSASAGGPSKVVTPSDCAFSADFTCADYTELKDCSCDPSAPHSRADCADPFDFQCQGLPVAPSNGEISTGSPKLFVGCKCLAPALRPADCSRPEAFFCARVEPDFADCECDEARVCSDPTHQCCQSSEPRFGCECCPVPIA